MLTLLILFQFQSLSADVLMQLLKKKITLRECPFTAVVDLVLYLDPWARMCSIFISIVISNTLSVAASISRIVIKKREGKPYQYRSIRLEMFCKKGVLRNFINLTGKHLCQSLFFNKVAGLRDSGRGVFLWVLWNF